MGSYSEKQIEKMLAPGPVLYPGRIKSKSLTNYTGTDIHYIGKDPTLAFAYSGLHAAHTTAATVISGTTGAGVLLGVIQLNGACDDDSPANRTATSLNILMNGVSVAILGTGDQNLDAPTTVKQDIIIPPFTKIEFILDMAAIVTDNWASAVLTGTVHSATTTDIGGL